MTTRKASRQRDPDTYRVPALEKGIDVLELLAAQSGGLTLSQIAGELGRTVQEIYRVVLSLERRGFAERDRDDTFRLTLRLFDLASMHPPLRRLVDAAEPLLGPLADELGQLVTLAVRDGLNLCVVAAAETSAAIGFRVRVGATRPLMSGASGRVLLAFRPEGSDAPIPLDDRDRERLAFIRSQGGEYSAGETLRGILDVSFPVVGTNGNVLAALTMPFLAGESVQPSLPSAGGQLYELATRLTTRFGGRQPAADGLMHTLAATCRSNAGDITI